MTKYSDDGESNGTAEIQIFNAINHFELFNILVVITRYYGGTKLGVGLLGKVYYDTACGVLKNASTQNKQLYNKIQLEFDYALANTVHRTLAKYSVKSLTTRYDQNPLIECYIKPELIPSLEIELQNLSKGQINITIQTKNLLLSQNMH
ncbi:YigZ family protein [Bacteroidota bacterium]